MARFCVLAAMAASGVVLATSCGASGGESRNSPPRASEPPARSDTLLIAALGDSITAGTPLFDPDPDVRAAIGERLDERSSYEYWAQRTLGQKVAFRNCGVNGQRTDEIATRLDLCADGAQALIVQGGINDIAQGRPVADAADDLRTMVRRGKQKRLRVAIVELLPWNNGYPGAAPKIRELNGLIAEIGRAEDVPVFGFFEALEDPAAPDRMAAELTIEGDHPSVEGYRRLGELVRVPPG